VEEIERHGAGLGEDPSVDGHVRLRGDRRELQRDTRQHVGLIRQDDGLDIAAVRVLDELEREEDKVDV
jgi:hypothetical protein